MDWLHPILSNNKQLFIEYYRKKPTKTKTKICCFSSHDHDYGEATTPLVIEFELVYGVAE